VGALSGLGGLGGLDEFLGCVSQGPSESLASFGMLRLVYALEPGDGHRYGDGHRDGGGDGDGDAGDGGDGDGGEGRRAAAATAAWAAAFQAATLHGRFAEIEVAAASAGSYDAELSAMSWRDLVLAVYWLPVCAGESGRASPGDCD
jgi:hypothetical protein